MPNKLDHPREGLINTHDCFEWSIVKHLNHANRLPVKVTKPYKDFTNKIDFKFPVKIRNMHKIEKINSIGISVFGYENK